MATELPVTAKVDTKRHLRMVAGEAELFKSTRTHGSAFSRFEDTMAVSNARVLFHWRQWFCGLCVTSLEEHFSLEDVQFVTLGNAMNWLFLILGFGCLIVGAALVGVADDFRRTIGLGWRAVITDNSVLVYLGVGLFLLLLGILMLIIFAVKQAKRGVSVTLNFSRQNVGILDWASGSWWRPYHSSTRRTIKLDRDAANEAYHVLEGLLQHKFQIKAHIP